MLRNTPYSRCQKTCRGRDLGDRRARIESSGDGAFISGVVSALVSVHRSLPCRTRAAAVGSPGPTVQHRQRGGRATPQDWTFDIGPGVVMAPWFEGGAYYRVLPVPNLDLRYRRDVFFVSARDGVGATLLDAAGFKAGPILRYRFPRNEWDGPGLFGTGSVPFTVEGGGFVRYDAPFLSAKVELRRGLGGSNGLVFDALLDGKLRLSDSVFLSGGPRLSVTDGTFNQAYFGINAGQSFNSGYAQYYPGAGLRSVGLAPVRCGASPRS